MFVAGVPEGWKKMKEKNEYTFLLKLDEGYKTSIKSHTCDPRVLDISLFDCLDCPKEKKKKKKK
ncbi:MAG: hypothetical protein ABIJ56_02950 [Pseudomonadota bacterium]